MSYIDNTTSSVCKPANQSQLGKTPDFISFNNSPCSSFTPPHYSSPVKSDNYRRNWNKNRNFKAYNRSNNSSGNYSENFSNSNSFSGKQYSSSRGSNRSNNYSRSYSENFNNSNSYSARQYALSQGSNNIKDEKNITRFLHPSFMEDPWRRLEEEHLQKTSEKNLHK